MRFGDLRALRKRMSGCGFAVQKNSRSRAFAVAVLALNVAAAAPAVAQQPQPAAVPVGTVYAERQSISNIRDFVGRVEATGRVDIRARVQGYLEQVLFKEGDIVKKGDQLYQIEKGLFQAAVEAAKGALERSKAAKTLTAIQLQRAQELLEKNAGTAVARDQALAADQQAQGQILADQANLDTANINLGYTDIASPIAGKVSKTNVTAGNVVGPASGILTLIVSQDPMYISFPVSQRELLQAQLSGRMADIAGIKIKIRFADGSTYKHEGTVNFIDVSVDRATDTVLGARHHAESRRRLDRRPIGQRRRRSRRAAGQGGGAAVGADRRSARRLCVRGRGRQGGRQADQDRWRKRSQHRRR